MTEKKRDDDYEQEQEEERLQGQSDFLRKQQKEDKLIATMEEGK